VGLYHSFAASCCIGAPGANEPRAQRDRRDRRLDGARSSPRGAAMNRARLAVKVLVAAGLAALIVAQARAVVFLHARLDAPLPGVGNTWEQSLFAVMAFHSSRFHLFGTLLAAALLLATMRGWLVPLEAEARDLFIPLAFSTLAWLGWAVNGFSWKQNWVHLVSAVAGLATGIVIPLMALVVFAIRLYRSPVERRAAGLGMIFTASILVWTLAFAFLDFSIALAM
jgi:hypothetical protein